MALDFLSREKLACSLPVCEYFSSHNQLFHTYALFSERRRLLQFYSSWSSFPPCSTWFHMFGEPYPLTVSSTVNVPMNKLIITWGWTGWWRFSNLRILPYTAKHLCRSLTLRQSPLTPIELILVLMPTVDRWILILMDDQFTYLIIEESASLLQRWHTEIWLAGGESAATGYRHILQSICVGCWSLVCLHELDISNGKPALYHTMLKIADYPTSSRAFLVLITGYLASQPITSSRRGFREIRGATNERKERRSGGDNEGGERRIR